MAIPRVFISSTCYDLKHIRENLKYFIKTIGYEPVLSDEGDVFYNPSTHTHDSCLKEVETCQIFILIIGGRYGGSYKNESDSITNHEYREAVHNNIPIFTLIESAVLSDHHVFLTNMKKNLDIANKIEYPSIDDIRIFDFIDEVRKNIQNNAMFPFQNFSDMETYLKKQWAGMMYDFIVQQSNEENSKITNRLLDDLALATKKSEELIKVLLKASSSDEKAEQAIQDVANRVEAENFVKQVLSRFRMDKLESSLEDLKAIPLNDSWVDFLVATNNFYLDEHQDEDGTDKVLWGTASHGIIVGHSRDGEYEPSPNKLLENSYQAIRNVDEKTREQIFLKMI